MKWSVVFEFIDLVNRTNNIQFIGFWKSSFNYAQEAWFQENEIANFLFQIVALTSVQLW